MTLVGLTALSVEISTKVSTPVLDRRLGRVPGAEDVVVNALDHVVFDDRHVLVGSGVIDRLDAESRHELRARDAGGARCRAAARARPPAGRASAISFSSRSIVVERKLRHLKQHQPAGREPHDLAAQLRADGAAGAGDQDALAADAGAEQRGFGGTGSRPSRSATSTSRSSSMLRLAGDQVRQVGNDWTCNPRGSRRSGSRAAGGAKRMASRAGSVQSAAGEPFVAAHPVRTP